MGSTASSARPIGSHVTVQSTARSPATRFVGGEVRMFRIEETVRLEVRGRRIEPPTPPELPRIRPDNKAQTVNSLPAVNRGLQLVQRQLVHSDRKKRCVGKRVYANITGNGTATNRRPRGAAGSAHTAGNRTKKTYGEPARPISDNNLGEDGSICDNDEPDGSDVRGHNGDEDDDGDVEESEQEETEQDRKQKLIDRTSSTYSRNDDDRQHTEIDDDDSSNSFENDTAAFIDLTVMEGLPDVATSEAARVACDRVREVTVRLSSGIPVTTDVLIANLDYVANILEAVQKSFSDPRRKNDETDSISEVETQNVPSQVRDWLMTFTRSSSNVKNTFPEKHRFRSVANVIRAGIVVEKIYRRMTSTVGLNVPVEVLQLLKNIDDWSFDVFSVRESTTDSHVLKYIGHEIMQKYELLGKFRVRTQTLDNFLLQVEAGYEKYGNPYHNQTHAADVTQTTHHLITQSGLAIWLTDVELFATIIAAIIHDYEHTGTTNAFHINTRSDIALLYNDRNILENHHVSAVFRLIKEDEDCNILSALKPNEYKEFRQMVIEIVIATDMSLHFQQIKTMRSLITGPESIDKCKALSLIVHCADISHPAKSWTLHQRWTQLLVQEFFRQGDREAEMSLPISPLCDRNSTMVAESQIGFIDFIVDPSFQVLADILDKIRDSLYQTVPVEPPSQAQQSGGERQETAASETNVKPSSDNRKADKNATEQPHQQLYPKQHQQQSVSTSDSKETPPVDEDSSQLPAVIEVE